MGLRTYRLTVCCGSEIALAPHIQLEEKRRRDGSDPEKFGSRAWFPLYRSVPPDETERSNLGKSLP